MKRISSLFYDVFMKDNVYFTLNMAVRNLAVNKDIKSKIKV